MVETIILLIDDNQTWAESMAEVLHDAGFEVRLAHDGEEGVELLESSQPRLVILDCHLPRIDGFELLQQFRQRDRKTPVLMISADDQASLQSRAMTAGASGFLRKPIPLSLLLRAVRRYVDRELDCLV
jgi:DNA-binding response OmpR family regulator